MKHLLSACLLLLFALGFSQNNRPEVPQQQLRLAPFYHGVASGDPLPTAVIIWTRFTPEDESTQAIKLSYTVATDTAFNTIVQRGSVFADPLNDFTAKVDVKNLQPNTYYYYAFTAPDGRNSLIGRTKTAPVGEYNHFRAAALSCTSIYSGYFNGYSRIAERNDLDLVIHLGDYLYDFVDGNGNNRIPDPFPETPKDLKSWRDRHDYYELDEDLIRARQQHPFVVVWDNHDVDDYDKDAANFKAANRAFYEWLPIRLKQDRLTDTLKIYQNLKFGNLVDVMMVDCYSYKDDEVGSNAMNFNNDEIDDENRSYLGEIQRNWLFDAIDSSKSTWRIFGSQKMMAPWCLGCFPDISGKVDFPVFNDNGNIFNVRSWDGYPAERKRLFEKLREKGFKNNLTLSGDAHLAFYADLTEDPFNLLAYNPITGGNSVGVELLPSSLSRENFDEILAAEGGGKPGKEYYIAAEIIANASLIANVHHRYSNFSDHGYALIDITPERMVGEFWVSEKMEVTSDERMMRSHSCLSGSGKWSLLPNLSPTAGKVIQADPAPVNPPQNKSVGISNINVLLTCEIYPNPTTEGIHIALPQKLKHCTIELLDLRSVVLQQEEMNDAKSYHFQFDKKHAAGIYFVRILTENGHYIEKLEIE